jgi:hypothetical protein
MLMGVKRLMVMSAITERPVEPIYDGIGPETILDLPADTYPRLVEIPEISEFPLDVVPDVPKEGELARYIRIDIPLVGEFLLDSNEDIPKVGEFFRDRGVDPPQVGKLPADCVLLRSAPIPSYEKIVGHYGALPTVIVTLPVSAVAAAAEAVIVLLNQILRAAAAATSPSAIAVASDKGVENDNPIGAVSSSTTLWVPVES